MPPPPPTPPALPLTLILAATPTLGIGRAGTLPWPQLKAEMAYFARVTRRVSPARTTGEGGTQGRKRMNAVLMGRRTWDSIPPRFRPLKGRLNVVVSRSAETQRRLGAEHGNAPEEGPLVVGSVQDALHALRPSASRPSSSSPPSSSETTAGMASDVEVGRVFVIGGASLYASCLALPQTDRVLLTKIRSDFECDTFFPLDLDGEEGRALGWTRRGGEELEGFVGEEVLEGGLEEDGVGFEFCLYGRD